jgi:hypothetical protein
MACIFGHRKPLDLRPSPLTISGKLLGSTAALHLLWSWKGKVLQLISRKKMSTFSSTPPRTPRREYWPVYGSDMGVSWMFVEFFGGRERFQESASKCWVLLNSMGGTVVLQMSTNHSVGTASAADWQELDSGGPGKLHTLCLSIAGWSGQKDRKLDPSYFAGDAVCNLGIPQK